MRFLKVQYFIVLSQRKRVVQFRATRTSMLLFKHATSESCVKINQSSAVR